MGIYGINWFVIAGSKVHLTQDTGGKLIGWIENNNKIALVNELVISGDGACLNLYPEILIDVTDSCDLTLICFPLRGFRGMDQIHILNVERDQI